LQQLLQRPRQKFVMTIVLANGKTYYNTYNFAIGTDQAEHAFAAPSSTAILNTITTTDRHLLLSPYNRSRTVSIRNERRHQHVRNVREL